jgi:hypothetical protein
MPKAEATELAPAGSVRTLEKDSGVFFCVIMLVKLLSFGFGLNKREDSWA